MATTELMSGFDYSALDSETRKVVKQKTGEIRERTKRAAQDIMEIGHRLIDVKQRLDHGQFSPWLRAEFEWDERTARRFIAVAETFKTDKLSDLNFAPSALYALSAPSVPEEARKEAVQQASNGQHITHSAAQQIVAKHRPEPPKAAPKPSAPPTPKRSSKMEDDTPAYEDETQEETGEDEESFELEAEDEDEEESEADSEPVVVLTKGPAFPPNGSPKATAGWERQKGHMNDIILFVENQGGIEGSVYGWKQADKTSLVNHLARFHDNLGRWLDTLRSMK